MEQTKKRVGIELKVMIQDDNGNENNKIKASGTLFQRSEMDVLTFKEKVDDLEINTLITIYPEKVSIKRSGAVSMHQQFRTNQLTENVYKHPHGNIHMETFTNKLVYEPFQRGESGRLDLGYTVKLNGQDERKHTLELIITEEDSE